LPYLGATIPFMPCETDTSEDRIRRRCIRSGDARQRSHAFFPAFGAEESFFGVPSVFEFSLFP